MTPTQRTLARLRNDGYTARVVERWNPWAHIRQDLWGLDVLAIRSDRRGVLGVQCCAGSSAATRTSKLIAIPEIRIWLQAGNSAEVQAWAKRGARGKRKIWTCRKIEIGLDTAGNPCTLDPSPGEVPNAPSQ